MDLMKFVSLFYSMRKQYDTLFRYDIKELSGIEVDMTFIGTPGYLINTKLLEKEFLLEILGVFGIKELEELNFSAILESIHTTESIAPDQLDRYKRIGKNEFISYQGTGIGLKTFKEIEDKMLSSYSRTEIKVTDSFVFYGDGVPLIYIKGTDMNAQQNLEV